METNHRLRIGNELRQARQARSLSIEEAAQQAGLRPATIRNIERGRFSADIDLLSMIADIYDCEIDLCDKQGYNFHPLFNEDIEF